MTDTKGSAVTVAVSAAGSSYTDITGLTDASINEAWGEVSANDFDEPNWEQSLIDRGVAIVSGAYNYDESDAGQQIIRTAGESTPPVQFFIRYRPTGDGSGVKNEIIFKCQLQSHDTANADGSLVATSFSVKSVVAPTFQQQP